MASCYLILWLALPFDRQVFPSTTATTVPLFKEQVVRGFTTNKNPMGKIIKIFCKIRFQFRGLFKDPFLKMEGKYKRRGSRKRQKLYWNQQCNALNTYMLSTMRKLPNKSNLLSFNARVNERQKQGSREKKRIFCTTIYQTELSPSTSQFFLGPSFKKWVVQKSICLKREWPYIFSFSLFNV